MLIFDKRSPRLSIVIYSVIAGLACAQAGLASDSSPATVKKVIEGVKFSDSSMQPLLLKDSARLQNVLFKNCTFHYDDYLRNVEFVDCQFDHCTIDELSLLGGKQVGVSFNECSIRRLDFYDVTLKQVEFRTCDSLTIDFRRCGISGLTVLGGGCERLGLDNCVADHIKFGLVDIGQLAFRAGRLEWADIAGIETSPDAILIHEVELVSIGISPQQANALDFKRSVLLDPTFRLVQEVDANSGRFGQHVTRSLYQEARNVYVALAKQFEAVGNNGTARFLGYKARVMDRYASLSRAGQILDYVWNEQLRGNYGTSPWVVLRSGLCLWLLFAGVYYILGLMKVAWGAYVPGSGFGHPIEAVLPRIIRPHTSDQRYGLSCLVFSMNQILLGGARHEKSFLTFAEAFMFEPRHFISVGLGRMVAGVEKIFGLVLLFSFVQAFLRLL